MSDVTNGLLRWTLHFIVDSEAIPDGECAGSGVRAGDLTSGAPLQRAAQRRITSRTSRRHRAPDAKETTR